MTSKILNMALLLALSLFGAQHVEAQAKDEAVAVIGTKKITVEEFNKKYTEIKTQTINAPPKNLFLEDLIRYEVGVQEAQKRNLEKDPIVQERFKQELYKALIEKEIGEKVQKIQVSEAEMQKWYKTNPEIRTSHILIEFKQGSTDKEKEEAKKRANEILEEVKASKRPFEELVKLYSDDALSKQAGGDIGWQTRVTLVPNYYETALAMKVGDVKGLIETQYGYHIMKVTGRRAYENANKRMIRAAVYDEKRKLAFNELFDKLKKGYSIKVNSKLIE
jgi:parvulin-like peptidyl-prolyl isomerase